ncbi:porin [Janthinobacterium psychrotolerans]|uniref:Outer membrane protein (Porin) n=1 Tax=Janthinobacterium psychrotolerans TaxID=1747903 RepID=A0A1A7BWS0_9BURK|nr:porin [Janthinobacterium psychrotolerans]OBV38036.1 Outer membrane protein (porin) [Janthinobacterium psychrotolerans]
MKKTVFALVCLGLGAVAGMGSAQAQSNVQVYGIATAGLGYVDKVVTAPGQTGSRLGLDSGQYTQSRLGFRGTEDLGGGLKASFVIEGGLTLDNGASGQGGATFGRRTTIGLEGAYGDLQLGRRKDYSDFIARQYSSASRMLQFTGKAHGNNLDRSTGERANNMVYYTSPKLAGLELNLVYAFGEVAGSTSTGQSLGLGANYDTGGPFALGFAYWQSKKGATVGATNSSSDQGSASNAGCNTATLGAAGDTCVQSLMVGGRYRVGAGVTLHGTWSLARQPLINAGAGVAPAFATSFSQNAGSGAFTAGGINNSRVSIIDAGLDYSIGSWLLKAGLIHSRFEFVRARDKGTLTAPLLGADYILSKRTLVYGTLGTMRASHMYSPGLTANGAPGLDNHQNALGLGVLHRF